jgi:hypothetical protein
MYFGTTRKSAVGWLIGLGIGLGCVLRSIAMKLIERMGFGR